MLFLINVQYLMYLLHVLASQNGQMVKIISCPTPPPNSMVKNVPSSKISSTPPTGGEIFATTSPTS